MKAIYLSIVFLLSFNLFAEERFLSHEDIPSNMLSRIKEASKHTVTQMKAQGVTEFGYDEASVKFLSEVITNERLHLSEKTKSILPELWGAYLGEVIIKRFGGKWVKLGDNYVVLVSQSHICFPMNKVYEQIVNGEIDSIYGFYLSTAKIANELANAEDGA